MPPGLLRRAASILLALAAVALGIGVAQLPLLWAAILLVVLVVVTATLMNPWVGLWVALLLGPTKPLTDYFVPALPLDLGQLALIITLGSWGLQTAHLRKRRWLGSPITLPLLIFIAAASLSLISALSVGDALKELLKWLQMLIVMLLVVNLEQKRGEAVVLGSILATAIVQALIGIWQFALRGEGPEHFLILDGRFYRAYGTFEQPNPYAGLMGLVAPVCLSLFLYGLQEWLAPALRSGAGEGNAPAFSELIKNLMTWRFARTIALLFLLCLLLSALLMSWSRGAWLGFAAAVIIVLLSWPRRLSQGALLVLIGVAAGYAVLRFELLPPAVMDRLVGFSESVGAVEDVRGLDVTPANYAVLERLAHWQAAREMARHHFWIGVGIGNYQAVYPGYALFNWPLSLGHAHNIYLNMLAETGIIGLAAYLMLWIIILAQNWRATRTATGWPRALVVGLMGTWTHLSVHSMLDKLYVANLHLHIGALLGLLSLIIVNNARESTLDRYD